MGLISAKLAGGLGNMLFQIAAAYGSSKKHNKELVCEINEISSNHGDYTNYLNNIFRNVKFVKDTKFNNWYGEINFSYSEIQNLDGNLL